MHECVEFAAVKARTKLGMPVLFLVVEPRLGEKCCFLHTAGMAAWQRCTHDGQSVPQVFISDTGCTPSLHFVRALKGGAHGYTSHTSDSKIIGKEETNREDSRSNVTRNAAMNAFSMSLHADMIIDGG